MSIRRNNLRWLAPMAVAVIGCNPLGDLDGIGFGPTKQTPYAFNVWPDALRMLKGDTVSFTATTCPEPCIYAMNVDADWSVSGIALVPQSALTASSAVLTRAEAAGTASVTAVSRADMSRRMTVTMTVLDSADVDEVLLIPWAMKNSSGVYQGARFDLSSEVRAKGFRVFRALPTSWSVSDTTIVRLTANENPYLPAIRSILVKKAGTVDVTARFLAVEKTLRLSVSP